MDIEKYLETFDDASVIHEIRTFIKEDGETGQELSLEIYSANDHFADLAARLWREGYERFDAQRTFGDQFTAEAVVDMEDLERNV